MSAVGTLRPGPRVMNRLDEARRTVVIGMSHHSMPYTFAGWLQFRPAVPIKATSNIVFPHDFSSEPGGGSTRFGTLG